LSESTDTQKKGAYTLRRGEKLLRSRVSGWGGGRATFLGEVSIPGGGVGLWGKAQGVLER